MTVINAKPTRLRFRRSGAQWLAAILTLVFVIPFAGSVFTELTGNTLIMLAPVAVLAVLITLAVAAWTLRSGIDVTAESLTVRALLGSRKYAWSQIDGFDTRQRTVYALLDSGKRLALPAVRAVDVPRLAEIGGGTADDQ